MRFSNDGYKTDGPQYLKTNVTTVGFVKDILKADTYAAAIAKVIASGAYAGTNVTLAVQGNGDLKVDMAALADLDPSGTALITDDLSLIYYSATEVILCVEITDKAITNDPGDTVTAPATTTWVREQSATA